MVDSRAWHGADGGQSEDIGAQSVSAKPRRQKSVRRGWQQSCQCVLPEPDVDDHGACVAVVRLPGDGVQEGEPLMSDHDSERTRRDVIRLGAAATAAVSLGVGHAEAQARAGGFLTDPEFATLDELSEMIIPTDAHSPGARAAKVAEFIDRQLAEAWDEKARTDW